MTTEKMTIHKALCELKTLDARIKKGVHETTFIVANKHSNTKISGKSVSDFCNEVKAAYQSVTDLISRRDAIKRAVVLSNAAVKVVVGGKEYTVAEAIEMKDHGIPLLKELLSKLSADSQAASMIADRNNGEALEMRANEYIKSLYGNSDMKNLGEEVKKTREDFISAQTVELVDPIGISGEMNRLEETITGFMVEIDSALSVSNALTEITVEY